MIRDRLLDLIIILVLLALAAFFTISKSAITAASRAHMQEQERRGDKRAALVQHLTGMRHRLLGAILLGRTVATIAASAIAASALVRTYGDLGMVYAIAGISILMLLLGDVLPRIYATTNPERLALIAAPLIKPWVEVLAPVVSLLEWIVKRALRLMGVNVDRADQRSAHDELRGAIALHHRAGSVVTKDRDMLGGILNLQDLSVSDVMVHRTKMVTVDRSEPPSSIIEGVLKSGHTRIPVWKESPENIIGILHAKDLLKEMQKHGGNAARIDLDDIISPPWFVPDTRPVADQLNAFLRRKTHFALVVDEYGEVMGLVTLEDIIEEIVGDIADEHDVLVLGVRAEAGGSYVVDGIVPVRDLNRLNDWDLPDEEMTTVAGLVIHEARMIPDVGQTFTFHGFRFEVLRRRRHQITSLRITPLKARKAPVASIRAAAP
jgi:magnesium and cobalt exporter, CNNM family